MRSLTFQTATARREPGLAGQRAGFTLVEMLVAILIMVILTTIVVAAFRQDDGDRLNASARLVQSYFEGARSRAITDGKVRGIRLIPRADDPFVVDSLVYIGATGHDTGFVNVDFDDSISNLWRFTNTSSGKWNRLVQRNLLGSGSRIEVPAGTGNWYYITAVSGNEVVVSGHYAPSAWDTNLGKYAPQPDPDGDGRAINMPYRLELAPAILPNTEPISLERGTVIDRAASRIPSLDIFFDSRGNPTGATSAAGLVHLYVTTLSDVELTRGLFPNHPANGGSQALPIVPASPPDVPEHEPYLFTLYTQTGQVTVSQVDFTDNLDNSNGNPGADLQADFPFRYAQRGREAR